MSKKDLFDDSTMTFGEHLEALRYHLWRAIIGLVIGSIVGFFISRSAIIAIQEPVNAAMIKVFAPKPTGMIEKSQWESFKDWISSFSKAGSQTDSSTAVENSVDPAMTIAVDAREVARKLHDMAPDSYAPPPEKAVLDSYQKAHIDGALLAIPDLSRDEILKQLDAWTPLAKAYA